MATKPLKVCSTPGCPSLSKAGKCEECRKKRGGGGDGQRAPWRAQSQKWYGSNRWKKARERFLVKHPICECKDCTTAERVQVATVVDHVKPHRGDPALFWDATNWMAMNVSCHNRKSAREQGNSPQGGVPSFGFR